jgi:hypothetical protein
MTMSNELKAVVSVSEMARMVRLSRARFYELVRAGVFPVPVYEKGRPIYTEELQETCLEVRRRNRGVNGEPVLFYARRVAAPPTPKKRTSPAPAARNKDIQGLLEGLNALGLTTATAAQIEEVTRELYQSGTNGLDQADVLRAVFLELRRRNSTGSVR